MPGSKLVDVAAGYTDPAYAAALAEFGTPRPLARSGGWVLQRAIPDFPDHDAMGCYPLFTCLDWPQLQADLQDIGGELVSISLVADPFGEYRAPDLRRCFRDVVFPFKEHFVVDLRKTPESFVSSHHRRYARKALGELSVEMCRTPLHWMPEWLALYGCLIERHNIRGIAAFSEDSFARQFAVPGIVTFRAARDQVTVGMALWYADGALAYYHLGAWSPLGYRLRASFALFSFAIQYFADRGVQWLNLGGGAGVHGCGADGLTRFKRGWATGTRTAYFCGRILNPRKYREIVSAKGAQDTDYFPAYRRGEFA